MGRFCLGLKGTKRRHSGQMSRNINAKKNTIEIQTVRPNEVSIK